MDSKTIAEVIREITGFLSSRGRTVGHEVVFLCPFHDDRTPSANWNPEKGTFICRSCGAKGGALKLGTMLPGFTMPIIKTSGLGGGNGFHPMSSQEIDDAHGRLLASPEALSFLAKERFISFDTVAMFRLGLSATEAMEFTYPIRGTDGWFPSVRVYRPGNEKGKRRWWRPAFTKISPDLKAPLFAWTECNQSDADPLILCEGEDKALALWSLGIPAAGLTLGASNWPAHWHEKCRVRNLVYIPDTDPAGIASIRNFNAFAEAAGAKSWKPVILPLPGTADAKDVTDFLRQGGTKHKLLDLVTRTEPGVFAVAQEMPRNAQETPTFRPHFVIDTPASPPAPPPPPPAPGAPGIHRSGLTDLGNAQRLMRLHGERLRYSWEWGKWLVWDKRHWSPNAPDLMGQYAKDVAYDLHRDAANTLARSAREQDLAKRGELEAVSAALKAWAQTTEKSERLSALVLVAKSEPGVRIKPEELDHDLDLYNFGNKTVNLKTMEAHAFRQSDFITKIAPVNYDPFARCPLWEKFLLEIMGGNDNLVRYLQRALGYSMTGSVKEQVLFFLHGSGANGKSTFIETVQKVMGKAYAKSAAPNILLTKTSESHPTEIADLVGVRFVSTIEVGSGRRMAEVLVKQLTGGDTIKARRMREDFWEFEPTHKIWLAANHKPDIEGTDYAIWRRIRLIPFLEKFEGERKDGDLKVKLEAELAGIAAWMVRGALVWRQQGLADPPEVLAATAAYKDEMDVLGDFITEECITGQFNQVSSRALYEAYSEWHKKARGGPIPNQKTLGMRLTERGYKREHGRSGWRWIGFSIRQNDESGDGDADVRNGY